MSNDGADPTMQPDIDLHVQEILLAASQHDIPSLENFLNTYSFPDCKPVDVEDQETGFTPLHAAVAACGSDEDDQNNPEVLTNGTSSTNNEVRDQADDASSLAKKAEETVRFLLSNGAIWNPLDRAGETPGCIAHRLNLTSLYECLVDAGVRAELLLSRLEEYEPLEDSTGEDHVITETSGEGGGEVTGPSNGNSYLTSMLSLSGDRILDEESNAVMMSWESGIMAKSTAALLTTSGLRVLNIGFGMGIIDGYIQSHANRPGKHTIVEAHPTVLADMKTKGWYDKENVVVLEGRWQDVLPDLVLRGETFDAIYFDTFGEDYAAFRACVSEQIIGLLEPSGRFSFFNGMGADRQVSYDVYQKVVEMDLFELGFEVTWEDVDLPKLQGEWEGVKRRYWNVERYRLPVCAFMD